MRSQGEGLLFCRKEAKDFYSGARGKIRAMDSIVGAPEE
jgi:hypothetical protein